MLIGRPSYFLWYLGPAFGVAAYEPLLDGVNTCTFSTCALGVTGGSNY